jgi:cell wall-associated NlpC family hydrolase
MTAPTQLSPVAQAQAEQDMARRKQSFTNPLYMTNQQTYAQTYGQNNAPKVTTAAQNVPQQAWTNMLDQTKQYTAETRSGQNAIIATQQSQKAAADLKRWQESVASSQAQIQNSFATFQNTMLGKYHGQPITYTKLSGRWVDQAGNPVDAHQARVIDNNLRHGLNADGTPKISLTGNDGIPARAGSYIFSDPKDAQIAAWARQAGWAETDIPMVIRIAQAESSRSLTATNSNPNGSTDYGLMQINTIHNGDGGAINSNFFSGGGWKDPVQNLAAALQIKNQAGGGWGPWTTFTNGAYNGYNPQYTVAPQALGSTTTPSGGALVSGSTGLRAQIVNQGLKYLGTPYVYAGDSLTQGVDCSGLVHSLYQMFGFEVPRTARQDARPQGGEGYGAWARGDVPGHVVGTIRSKSQLDSSLMVGDLLTFKGTYLGPNEFGHVGIYIGNGQMLESPDVGLTVRVRNIRTKEYDGRMRGIHLSLPGDNNRPTPHAAGVAGPRPSNASRAT